MEVQAWEKLVTNVGFPIAIVTVVGLAIWIGAKWVANQIIIPIRDRGFKFIDKVEGNVEKMSDNLETQTMTLQSMDGKQSLIHMTLQKIEADGCGFAGSQSITQAPSSNGSHTEIVRRKECGGG